MPHADGYAECYPSYYDQAGAAYDSEDDNGRAGEPEKAVIKAGADGEAKPGGGAGGGKRREAAKREQKEKAKISTEADKIQKIFEEKGFGNQEAFDARRRAKSRAVEGEQAVPTKKRRI